MIVSNNKGITLIALVITIVVLLILASIGIGGAITGVDESTDQKLKSELKMVQHAVLQRYTKYSLTKDETMLVGDKIEEENLDSNITWQKQGSYYRINNEQFKELGITDIKDTYIVNYKTGPMDTKFLRYLQYVPPPMESRSAASPVVSA